MNKENFMEEIIPYSKLSLNTKSDFIYSFSGGSGFLEDGLHISNLKYVNDNTLEKYNVDLENKYFSVEYESASNVNKTVFASRNEECLKLANEFLEKIRSYPPEVGEYTQSDIFFEDLLKNYKDLSSEVVQKVWRNNYDNQKIISSLLLIISRFEFSELGDWAAIMAASGASSKSIIVKENSIRCFESWGDSSNLVILNNIDVPDWLKGYLQEVVDHLNGK